MNIYYQDHNWKYDIVRQGHVCEPVDLYTIPTKDRCYGCGKFVSDESLYNLTLGTTGIKLAYLNLLASQLVDELASEKETA